MKADHPFYRGKPVLRLIAVLTLFIPLVTAFGQTRPVTYTIKELVERSLQRNSLLLAGKSRIRESEYARKRSAEWYNPELGFQLGRKNSGGESGPVLGLSLTQKILFPGKMALREEMARLEENRSRLSQEEMELFIRYEVVRLAYEYAVMYNKTDHIRDRLKRLQLINTYMKGRLIVSPQKIVERRIVEAKIVILEKEVYKIGSDLRNVFARLNLYAGFKEKEMPMVQTGWFSIPPALDEEDLDRKARKSSFVIRMQRENLKKTEKERELSGKEVYPDLGLSIFYNEEKAGVKDKIFGAGISVPLPLFTRHKSMVEMSGARADSEMALLKHTELSVSARIKELHAQYSYISSILKRFPVSDLKKLEGAMRYADREFRRGRLSLQTYLEMDTQTHELIEMIYSTQLDFVRAYTELLFLASETRNIDGDK